MKGQILQPIEDVWRHHRTGLESAIDDAITELKELLNIDEYHHHAHDPEQLDHAMGPMGAANLDLGSLSRTLGESTSSRAMSPERVKRLQELIPALERMKQADSATLADSASVEIDEDEREILKLAEKHVNQVADLFRTLRIADLEIRSKYESEIHDMVFADFNWRQLGPAELRLCPPFLVVARLDDGSAATLRKMISLLESGMPIKIVALRSSFREVSSTFSDNIVPPKMTVETLPLAMRGVYFVQTCVAAADFEKQLFEGLTAPRPTVISLLVQREDEDEAAFHNRAERAVLGRAFPMCIYDPDHANGFVTCLDVSSNPSPDALWASETLAGHDPQSHPVEIEESFTFAHFAATEPEFAADLTNPPPIIDPLVAMTEYLGLSRKQRAGKLPFVWIKDADGTVLRKVVSLAIAQQCAERLHLWRTLQELSGIDNPYVNTTRSTLEKELGAEQQERLKSLREQMEKLAAQREQVAVASAMRNLVAQLTGVKPES